MDLRSALVASGISHSTVKKEAQAEAKAKHLATFNAILAANKANAKAEYIFSNDSVERKAWLAKTEKLVF